jgi:hypothetical protein
MELPRLIAASQIAWLDQASRLLGQEPSPAERKDVEQRLRVTTAVKLLPMGREGKKHRFLLRRGSIVAFLKIEDRATGSKIREFARNRRGG